MNCLESGLVSKSFIVFTRGRRGPEPYLAPSRCPPCIRRSTFDQTEGGKNLYLQHDCIKFQGSTLLSTKYFSATFADLLLGAILAREVFPARVSLPPRSKSLPLTERLPPIRATPIEGTGETPHATWPPWSA